MSIELKDVKRYYNTLKVTVKALRGINLQIGDGEFISVAGPSGSGKSTLLNLIGCIDEPTEGSIFYNNTDITSLKGKKLANFRNRNIGFVFQSFNLIPVLSAFENIEFPLILQGIKSSKAEKRVNQLIDRVELSDAAHRRPAELSGGQQQRVAIARALVKNPAIVLADEPTANIDSETALKLLSLMKELNQEIQTTFIFSTHDPIVMQFAQRLIKLKDGLVIDDIKREA